MKIGEQHTFIGRYLPEFTSVCTILDISKDGHMRISDSEGNIHYALKMSNGDLKAMSSFDLYSAYCDGFLPNEERVKEI